jgi:membrane protease YdiL (CAAX protease family)
MFSFYKADLLINLESVFLIGLATFSYLIMEFYPNKLIIGRFVRKAIPSLSPKEIDIISTKYGGFLWLGIIPALVWSLNASYSLADTGVVLVKFEKVALWVAIFAPVAIIVNYFAAKSQANLSIYPLIRQPIWDRKILFVDLGSWFFYLLGYEYFFRGLLLFGLIPTMGVWNAIAINTMAYALVHIPKGGREAFGAIPMGILLCLVTLDTGSIWAAFLIHLSLAWSNELFSLRYHKNIHYKRNA